MILNGYLLSIIYGAFCLLISNILYKKGISTFYTRKITHILVGFEWIIIYIFLGTTVHSIIICFAFLLLLTISYITNMFPQISSNDENSAGTVYYCIAMTVMAIISNIYPDMMVPFGIGAFCTSIGDGFAGVFGQIKFKNKFIYNNKTLFGSVSCFVFSFLSVIVFSYVFDLKINPVFATVIAIIVMEVELVSRKGIDNILVTFVSSALSFAFIRFGDTISHYILPMILTIPIVILAKKKNSLDSSAILCALVLDLAVSIAFGNVGFLILLVFFGGSIFSDRIKNINTGSKIEKRISIQVLANGGDGMLFALLYLFYPEKIWFIAFSAAFAEALADTSASGIGIIDKRVYDIFRFKTVEPGVSGGISLIGTIVSLVSSLAIASITLIFPEINIIDALIVAFSGFAGSILDSLLGSFVQTRYKCKRCKMIVEDKYHCFERCEPISRVKFIDNNMVNFLSVLFSSILAISICCFLQ